jgi:hypothetical protein
MQFQSMRFLAVSFQFLLFLALGVGIVGDGFSKLFGGAKSLHGRRHPLVEQAVPGGL